MTENLLIVFAVVALFCIAGYHSSHEAHHDGLDVMNRDKRIKQQYDDKRKITNQQKLIAAFIVTAVATFVYLFIIYPIFYSH